VAELDGGFDGSRLLLRRANVDDGARLAALRHGWRTLEQSEPGQDLETYTTSFIEWMAAQQATHSAHVAEWEGEIIGMVWIAITPRVLHPDLCSHGLAQVQSMYVVPALRGRGVGRRLIAAAADACRRMDCDYIFVHPNDEAVDFYRSVGFVERRSALVREIH
jgi:GNAT superfamily N-acetyltransferase